MRRLAAALLVLVAASAGADNPGKDWPDVSGRRTVMWRALNAARVTHFDGTYCMVKPGTSINNPALCGAITTNVDVAEFSSNNLYVGVCSAYVYGVTGTWNDGVDAIAFDIRFQNLTTSSDSTTTLTVTADNTWTFQSFMINDPFVDFSQTANIISYRPSINSLTDADASVTDVDIIFTCEVSEYR